MLGLVGTVLSGLAAACSSTDDALIASLENPGDGGGVSPGPDATPGSDATTKSDAGDASTGDATVGDSNAGDTNVGDTNVADTNTGDSFVGDGNAADTNVPDAPLDAGPPPSHAKLVIVHAAPGMPPFRICFGTGVKNDGSDLVVAALPVLPDAKQAPLPYAGFFNGTASPLPDITDLSSIAITPFLVSAAAIQAYDSSQGTTEPDCTQFIGIDGKGTNANPSLKLAPGKDYFPMPTIPAGTFIDDATFLVSVTGCLPDVADAGFSAALCGATWSSATGNLAMSVAQLDTKTVIDGGIGVQFAHRASPVEGLPGTADTTAVGGGPDTVVHAPASNGVIPAFSWTADGGSGPVPSLEPLSTGPVKYSASAVAPPVAFAFSASGPQDPTLAFGVGMVKLDGGVPTFQPWPAGDQGQPGAGDYFSLPLPVIQLLSGPMMDGGFTPGETYTMVLLGDPTKTIGAIEVVDGGLTSTCAQTPNNPAVGCNPLFEMHFVAIPNHLAVPVLQ
jgi:hypothetical protein